MSEEIHYLQVNQLSEKLASKKISPVEATQHFLQRLDKLEPTLNAFNVVTADLALEQAQLAEKEILNGKHRGPLHGVPIAVKDIFFTDGIPTTAGMAIHQNFTPDHEATVIKKLRDAGAVLLGKTNLTEGVYGEHRPPFGPPVNPWNADYWPGASSSGSGVAVAAGMCAAALGSETGGSIRLPSAANGVNGLKPTWSRVSRYGVFELAATLDHVGPLARSVEDAALMLSVIAGADINDPTASLLPVPEYLKSASSGVSNIRIGVDSRWINDSVDEQTRGAFDEAIKVLSDLGTEQLQINVPDVSEMIWDWFPICAVQTALAHADTFPSQREQYGPALASLLDMGIALSGTEYQALILKREEFAGRFNALFEHVDVIALPVLSFPSPSMERMNNLDDDLIAGIHQFTCPFNLSRHPSLVLKCGKTSDNMPIVFQLIGKYFDEQTLVNVGRHFQNHTEWHLDHPTL